MLASSLAASDRRRTMVRVVREPAPFADRPCLRAPPLPTPRVLFPRTALTPVTLRRPVSCLLPVLDCEGPRSRPAPALLDRLPGLSPAARALGRRRGLTRAPRRCTLVTRRGRVVAVCRPRLTLQATSAISARLPVPAAAHTCSTMATPGASTKRVERGC